MDSLSGSNSQHHPTTASSNSNSHTTLPQEEEEEPQQESAFQSSLLQEGETPLLINRAATRRYRLEPEQNNNNNNSNSMDHPQDAPNHNHNNNESHHHNENNHNDAADNNNDNNDATNSSSLHPHPQQRRRRPSLLMASQSPSAQLSFLRRTPNPLRFLYEQTPADALHSIQSLPPLQHHYGTSLRNVVAATMTTTTTNTTPTTTPTVSFQQLDPLPTFHNHHPVTAFRRHSNDPQQTAAAFSTSTSGAVKPQFSKAKSWANLQPPDRSTIFFSKPSSSSRLLVEQPEFPPRPTYGSRLMKLRWWSGRIINHPRIQFLIILLIVTNALLLGLDTIASINSNPQAQRILGQVDKTFLIVFTVESALQLLYHGWRLFRDSWLTFDFVIVGLSWYLDQLPILRSVRVFRALRLLNRLKSLRNLTTAMIDVLPTVGAILSLLLLIMYIYAVFFTEVFRNAYELGFTDADYFGTLDKSLFTLFEMVTLEWAGIARQLVPMHKWVQLVIPLFLSKTGFILYSLVIAVICETVSEVEHHDEFQELRNERHGIWKVTYQLQMRVLELTALQHDVSRQLTYCRDSVVRKQQEEENENDEKKKKSTALPPPLPLPSDDDDDDDDDENQQQLTNNQGEQQHQPDDGNLATSSSSFRRSHSMPEFSAFTATAASGANNNNAPQDQFYASNTIIFGPSTPSTSTAATPAAQTNTTTGQQQQQQQQQQQLDAVSTTSTPTSTLLRVLSLDHVWGASSQQQPVQHRRLQHPPTPRSAHSAASTTASSRVQFSLSGAPDDDEPLYKIPPLPTKPAPPLPPAAVHFRLTGSPGDDDDDDDDDDDIIPRRPPHFARPGSPAPPTSVVVVHHRHSGATSPTTKTTATTTTPDTEEESSAGSFDNHHHGSSSSSRSNSHHSSSRSHAAELHNQNSSKAAAGVLLQDDEEVWKKAQEGLAGMTSQQSFALVENNKKLKNDPPQDKNSPLLVPQDQPNEDNNDKAKRDDSSTNDDDNKNEATENSLASRCHRGFHSLWSAWNKVRWICGRIVDHPQSQLLIVMLIVINALLLGFETFDFVASSESAMRAFGKIDQIFLILFTIESAMQLIYHGFSLFRDAWLTFDFIVIQLSWYLDQLPILRGFRVFRAIRLINRLDSLRSLTEALIEVLPTVGAILSLLVLVMYIYAVFFTELFRDAYAQGLTDEDYFGTLPLSLLTLFELVTLEWVGIARQLVAIHSWVKIVVPLFLAKTSFILYSLVIAVICMSVSEMEHHDENEVARHGKEESLLKISQLQLQVFEMTSKQFDLLVQLHTMVQEIMHEEGTYDELYKLSSSLSSSERRRRQEEDRVQEEEQRSSANDGPAAILGDLSQSISATDGAAILGDLSLETSGSDGENLFGKTNVSDAPQPNDTPTPSSGGVYHPLPRINLLPPPQSSPPQSVDVNFEFDHDDDDNILQRPDVDHERRRSVVSVDSTVSRNRQLLNDIGNLLRCWFAPSPSSPSQQPHHS